MMHRGWTGRSGALSMAQKMVRFIFQSLNGHCTLPLQLETSRVTRIIRDNLLPRQDFDSETQT